jgi:UDP-N-acetyl-D-galactosamine dehydrogenase
VVDIYHTLEEYTNDLTVYDPWANADHVKREYGIEITNEQPQRLFDAVILAVAHQEFLQMDVRSMVKDQGVIYDVKGVLSRDIVDGRL